MNKTQAQRLLNVANAVEDAVTWKSYFDMVDFGTNREEAEEKEHSIPEWVPHNCGAPSCALGHYAVRKDLQKMFGLDEHGIFHLTKKGWGHYSSESFYDIREHFGLSEFEMYELFDSDGCGNAGEDAKAVVKYIHDFLADRGWEVRA